MPKQMIKRKDGSYSQRGLWDNIRANAGSGKKPTKQMLKQEKKINSMKKNLRKAQNGISVTEGPLEEHVQKHLDKRYPGNTDQEKEYRAAEESSVRSPMYRSDFNKGMLPANYYSEDNVYKTGGSIMKGSQLRRQSSTNGLRTSKKHK